MDYLDRLIQLAQVEGEINILCRFQGNWQIKHQNEPSSLGIFHIISAICILGLEFNLR